jgi:hypothetical protein|tara:strand:+ start:1512 stop:2645 length:1134 start_codon:yes stop_codon:yes gene_type:complete
MGCTCEQKQQEGPPAKAVELPTTGYSFISPYIEDYSRRILGSYFGEPGQYEGLISQERPIPIEGTAQLSDLERQAATGAGGLERFAGYTPEGINYLRDAGALARDPMAAAQARFNPYEDAVVQQSIDDITKAYQQQDIGIRDDAYKAGAYGGSRGRLAQAENQTALGRGLLDAVSGIRRQGFQDAQTQVGQNIGQLSNIGSGISNLAGAGQQQAIGRIGAMATQGAAARGIEQADMSRRFRAADKLADEPFNRLQRGQQLLAGMPAGGVSGGTGAQIYQPQVFTQPSPLSQAAGLASAVTGAVAMSDVELKENIRRVGDYDNNLGWYEWDWNNKAKEIGIEAEPTAGFLAQEVLEVEPEAVTIKDGYYAVDYSRLMK